MRFDFCVIGGGIVGLAAARALLLRYPGASLALFEKEGTLGAHQSSHNSGVIHAGVYYQPGSLKAQLCRKGTRATVEFCKEYGIPHAIPGKLIVATSADELGRMEALRRNAEANGLTVHRLEPAELAEREPSIHGAGALFVPSTGIADYGGICRKLGELLLGRGAEIHLGEAVTAIEEAGAEVEIRSAARSVRAAQVVVCGGLQADRLARMSRLPIDFRIVPFRGEYYCTTPERAQALHHLVYPVPDPALPFLGVHFTPTVDGGLSVGPNAVLGFAREGYRKFSFDAADLLANLGFGGLWRVGARHWRFALEEFRDSLWKPAYLEKCRRYWPTLEAGDLLPWRAGIRAQAVMRNGELVHDFLFAQTGRVLHVCNAPSPAATSALPIAQMITDKVDAMRRVQP